MTVQKIPDSTPQNCQDHQTRKCWEIVTAKKNLERQKD